MPVGTRNIRNELARSFDPRSNTTALLMLFAFSCLLTAGTPLPASAQTGAVVNLHSFGLSPDGDSPSGPLVLAADGSFVGTTYDGGANGTGSVYAITPSGTETVLYSFSAVDATAFTNADGANPLYGVTLGSDGNYYGCTTVGGASSYGTAFMLTPAGVFTTLHSFTSTDGAFPIGLAQSSTAGTFYGTCESGGANNSGTIFKMTVAGGGGTVTTLYSFTALDTSGNNTDGADPVVTPIIGMDGNLYGTTLGGGNTQGMGAANGESVGGTVWTYNVGSSTFKVLHLFTALDVNNFNTDGTRPDAGLVQLSDKTLIGSCEDGGAAGAGTVFDITTDGATYTVYHSFGSLTTVGGTVSGTNADGIGPSAGVVQLSDNSVYGTCEAGGTAGSGTVFKIVPPTSATSAATFSLVYTFGAQATSVQDGADAEGNLIEDKAGNVYGTTAAGGANEGASGFGLGGIFFQLPLSLPTTAAGLAVTSVSPPSAQAGSAGFPLTVNGSGFDKASTVHWQVTGTVTQVLQTTYVSATQVTAFVPSSLLGVDAVLNAGTPEKHGITVVNTDTNTTTAATSLSSFLVNPSVSTPPAITGLAPASVTAGSAATTLVITGTNVFAGDTVAVAGTVLTPTLITATQVTVTVPSSLLTKAQTLSVTVSSSVGTSKPLALTVSPVTTYFGGLQFIALPYDYAGVALSDIFGYASPKLAVWNPAASVYAVTPNAPADAIRLGRGYWLRFPTVTGVALAGTPAAAGTPVSISLSKGWNMIGDPFTTTAPGTGITVVDAKNTTYTFSDAATAGIIDSSTYSYDLGSGRYILETTGDMKPFAGYWIFADAPCTLFVNGS